MKYVQISCLLLVLALATGCLLQRNDNTSDEKYPTNDDYFERRMQILEHRINSVNPEDNELRGLLVRLKKMENTNHEIGTQVDTLQENLSTITEFNKNIASLEERANTHDAEIKALRKQLDTRLSVSSSDDNTRPIETMTDDTENHIDFVSTQIQRFKKDKEKNEEIIDEIMRYEDEAIPILVATLNDRSSSARITGTKQALIRIGTNEVVDQLIAQLKGNVEKFEAADIIDVLGDVGNRRAEAPLENILRSSDDQFFRLDVAYALAKMDNEKGISALIDFLDDSEPNRRTLAIKSLREQFGKDQGYLVFDSDNKRNKAVQAWRRWYEENYEDDE